LRVEGRSAARSVVVDVFTVCLLLVEEVGGEVRLGSGGSCENGSGGEDAQDRFYGFVPS